MSTLIERNIGYIFKNKQLLRNALHHSSLKYKGLEFERLEFLGDRVLGLVISEVLYKNEGYKSEGILARNLASLVSGNSCQKIAVSVGIDRCVETANNEVLRGNPTVLADTTEAIIGAIFLDSSYEIVKQIVLKLWDDMLQNTDTDDPKTQLQEIAQSKNESTPNYVVISKTGTEHEPCFTVETQVFGMRATGSGTSKKMAETDAARKMLRMIKERHRGI
jgi:ribonuclease-3